MQYLTKGNIYKCQEMLLEIDVFIWKICNLKLFKEEWLPGPDSNQRPTG